MHWQGLTALVIATVAAIFLGSLLWRRDNIPGAAYWSFSIFLAFNVARVFLLQETDIATPWGTFSYVAAQAARTKLTNLEAQVAQLQRNSQGQPQQPHWVLQGEGSDCPGHDIPPPSSGPGPDEGRCTSSDISAVCWDGELYFNKTGPSSAWCTYKNIPPNRCVGGGAPGRLFQVQSHINPLAGCGPSEGGFVCIVDHLRRSPRAVNEFRSACFVHCRAVGFHQINKGIFNPGLASISGTQEHSTYSALH